MGKTITVGSQGRASVVFSATKRMTITTADYPSANNVTRSKPGKQRRSIIRCRNFHCLALTARSSAMPVTVMVNIKAHRRIAPVATSKMLAL
jgi:hypothetical protein